MEILEILGILGALTYLVASYFIGNSHPDIFGTSFLGRFASTLAGMGILLLIGLVILFLYCIYYLIAHAGGNAL